MKNPEQAPTVEKTLEAVKASWLPKGSCSRLQEGTPSSLVGFRGLVLGKVYRFRVEGAQRG